jgi:hypothetical protein
MTSPKADYTPPRLIEAGRAEDLLTAKPSGGFDDSIKMKRKAVAAKPKQKPKGK